jgi:hypothetical protein
VSSDPGNALHWPGILRPWQARPGIRQPHTRSFRMNS